MANRTEPSDIAYQFLIVLGGTDPLVWRRIVVPAAYSFWDLHVAIQDAMGWLDMHLHEFTLTDRRDEKIVRIGIPDEDFPDERPCLPGWKVPITDYFGGFTNVATYHYDFGDSWMHSVQWEDYVQGETMSRLPACIGGANACPPEDCGGPFRYPEFLKAISDPRHPEHEESLTWIGGTFDPHEFDSAKVRFDDPKKRWKIAFS